MVSTTAELLKDPQTLAAYVQGLESQLDQLRDILLNGADSSPAATAEKSKPGEDDDDDVDALADKKKFKALEEENKKLRYRIKILLRTVAAGQDRHLGNP
ncbi:hypothetical protein HDU67_010361 [Dinochytrium kinnereticum]|nr:hypothetical protein HDU67_010361 [Dinochytrium kinnereticum]